VDCSHGVAKKSHWLESEDEDSEGFYEDDEEEEQAQQGDQVGSFSPHHETGLLCWHSQYACIALS